MKKKIVALKRMIVKEIQYFPLAIRFFILKVVLLSVFWYGVYDFVLYEPRTLDQPLTEYVGKGTAWGLNLVYQTNNFHAEAKKSNVEIEGQTIAGIISHVYLKDRLVIFIADGCNGLQLLILYIIFIIALPASLKRKLLFGVFGMLLIHIVNILRCIGLVFILLHYNQYFVFAHHFIFKLVVYITIFILWYYFGKGIKFKTVKDE